MLILLIFAIGDISSFKYAFRYRPTPELRTTPCGLSTYENKDHPSVLAASTGGYLNWEYPIPGEAQVKYSGISYFSRAAQVGYSEIPYFSRAAAQWLL